MAFAQEEKVDIDEWQVMKVEAAKDPFIHGVVTVLITCSKAGSYMFGKGK